MFDKELIFLDDYVDFAEKYLGIDYEDYVKMMKDVELSTETADLEFQLV
jgi:hypothetical protein